MRGVTEIIADTFRPILSPVRVEVLEPAKHPNPPAGNKSSWYCTVRVLPIRSGLGNLSVSVFLAKKNRVDTDHAAEQAHTLKTAVYRNAGKSTNQET